MQSAEVQPEVQTPFGVVPRCRARSKRSGLQCAKPARRGFSVCSTHGAGTRRREQAGLRKNPALAALKTGLRARPSTIATWEALHVQYAERLAAYRRDQARLRDGEELLAGCGPWRMCSRLRA